MARPNPIRTILRMTVVALWLAGTFGTGGAAAQSVIRDAEIENIIADYAAPLLKAARIDPEAFRFHIINRDELNAFVANGQRMFLTTGLLRRADGPGQVMGVIAHELGHIAGGHLARRRDAMDRAAKAALISQILGVAVGALSGEPGAAAVLGTGGASVAQRALLSFSRGQEQAADQAGLHYLDEAGISAAGLLGFMEILEQQEFLYASRQDPYLLTHPLTRERVRFVRNHVRTTQGGRPVPPGLQDKHRIMVAKLDGFLAPPGNTLDTHEAGDRSVPARYARAIAYYRQPDLDEALALIDGLIAEQPDNPYFHELKGQMLFENGRAADALPVYREAVRLAPREPLLLTSLAHVEIELNRADLLDDAQQNLERALGADPSYPLAWRLAATAQGRRGEMGPSALSLAEYNLLIGRRGDARGLAQKAARLFKEGSPGWLRAQDIITEAAREPR